MSDWNFLRGIWNITPTPFDSGGALDEPSLRTLTDFTVERGVDGMTILGVLGEAGKLGDAERDRVIAVVVEQAAGRIPICAGTSHAATDQCIAFSRRAQELGAQAIMVAPPRLARPNDAALRRHYLAVAEAVDLPIVVQDHPASSGVYMSVEFVAQLSAEAPACRFLKLEDEPSPPKVAAVRAADERIAVFGGLGGMMFLEELRRGAAGTMTGFGFPEILVEIYNHWTAGDHEAAADVFYRACPLIRFENQPLINLALRKEIYRRRGAIATARVRLPAMALDAGTIADLDDLLTRLKHMEVIDGPWA